MEFVVKLRKDVRPCHSRYHPELRVTDKNSGGAAGVTSTPLQVLGMGGSRVVAVAPHQENLVWKLSVYPQDQERKVCRLLGATTPTPVTAAGVHQMTEEGHDKPQDPMWVTMLECERVGQLSAADRLAGAPGPVHHSYGLQDPTGERLGTRQPRSSRAPSW